MNHAPKQLSDAQIQSLHMVMEGGNSQVSSTLDMLTRQNVEQNSVRIKVISGAEVMKLMDPGPDALVTVFSSVHGDVEGDFLFLQTERDFQTLGPALIGQVQSTVDNATDFLIPNWLNQNSQDEPDKKELQVKLLNANTETGNVLFGIYLTALYNSCKLGTYQDVPTTAVVDEQHSVLKRALSRNTKETNIAFLIEIDYVIAQKSLKAWLLMLPLKSGLDAILETMGPNYAG